MRRSIVLAVLTFACSWVSLPGRDIRVMTYNVHNGVGVDKVADYGRIGRLVASFNPDAVAIQEVDSMTARSNHSSVLDSIGRAAGLVATFAPAIEYDGGRYGIGVLSKESPLSSYSVPLPGREEARTMLVCEFSDYVFACVHLSLTEADRISSADIIRAEAEKWHKPFFIAGDWNASPESAVVAELSEHMKLLTDTAVPTFPSTSPTSTIDYIAAYGIEPSEVESIVFNGHLESDHLPVGVRVEW